MTGRTPVSVSCISKAAESVELDGQQHTGFLVMTSLTFIDASPDHNQAERVDYFACSDSMYLFRLVTRNCTSELCPSLMPENRSPQTGISFVPCAASRKSPWIAVVTWSDGYLPPFFFASAVRSGGRTFSASTAGP